MLPRSPSSDRLAALLVAIFLIVEGWRGGWLSRESDPDRRLPDACARGDVDAVRALLAEGVGPDVAWTPADAAAQRRGLRKLLGDDADERLAAQLEANLALGPWPHLVPLLQAVEGDHLDVVEILLGAGADPGVVDSSGQGALFFARSVPVIRRLVAAGLDLGARQPNGWDVLTAAAVDGDLDRVRALLDAGADPNATHDHGFTVLMAAAGAYAEPGVSAAILRLLVERGADPHAVSDYGWNALHAAVDVNGEANGEASVRERLGTLRSFGVDLEARNHEGATPLARAVIEGSGVEVAVLCELGADATVRAPGRTCPRAACPLRPLLHHAARGWQAGDKVRALLRAGADPTEVDEEGRTALDRAREGRAGLEGAQVDGVGTDVMDGLRADADAAIAVLEATRR